MWDRNNHKIMAYSLAYTYNKHGSKDEQKEAVVGAE